ncbi:MAG TPA: PepSY-associated TM helix domain-containing protein [Hyphomicrobiaceae bacterium]|nr:PepSY-associated TM helix domain-containing protein [Hyphomicrobiaceae bacterium]
MQARSQPRPRKRQVLPPDFVRAMLAGHSALGLAFAWLIYVVCLSGTAAVFANEFRRWEQPDGPTVHGSVSPESVATALAGAYAQALADTSAHDVSILGPALTGARLVVSYHDHRAGIEEIWLADAQGRLVMRARAPWTEFLTHLHINLHLPRAWGTFIVGLTGVALLSSLVSGLLAHPRVFKDAFALRWGGSRRLQEADLHNRLGVWGLPFHVVVSLTGAMLGLATLVVGVLALAAYEGDSEKAFATLLGPRAGPDRTPAAVPDVASMIRHVLNDRPGATFVNGHFEQVGKAGQVVHLGMRTPGHIAFSNTYFLDGTGKSLGDGGLEQGGLGQQILGAIPPLHVGWFGGLTIKVVYGLLGLALTVVTHSGVSIWLARRRDKGRPAPVWERIWAAAAWGQPLALATSATAALQLQEQTILPVYLATVLVALLLPACMGNAAAITRALRLFTAAALAAAVLLHSLIWWPRATDPLAWFVSLSTLAAAAIIWPVA